MHTERITFTGHAGDTLSARLDLPQGTPRATALFAHCFTCSKDSIAARRISARLAATGVAVLRFDFTGLGQSEGAFEDTSFSSNVSDLIAAAQTLAERGLPPSLLIGHSLGGAAILKAARAIPSAKAVVTIGAPFDPAHVTHHFAGALPEIQAQGAAQVSLGGRPFTIGKAFVDDISTAELAPAIAQLHTALLVLHAPRDSIVSIDNAADIFMAAKHPKSFVTLDDADHLISKHQDAEYAADVITAWSKRYLPVPEIKQLDATPEGITRVTEAAPDGFLQDVQSGTHHALADEPKKYGGTDKGFTPYGFVAAGLGACTSMTIRMYARRKKWPLDGVRVDVSHAKEHAADAAEPGAKIDHFDRHITLTGDLSEDQRARLLEIADKCPVHRSLERTNVITTQLAPPA
ncbi:bifunctional alpha/beta hydrolase/OsmC family protein [Yoonia sp. I 8.24]|uniref:bifunctional alpha/beta hydrolase/OsmC family protein n=1 Tax=Yoonia sp. I 8.24 TaxID=1537229 RepID=UPI001EDDD2AF|nr:bifunctional alpha/beta hydrolase/OsmC family protein [Yoonia sp. I 8.24]MCG3266433.1 OsmC family protein [Yoonia sp. I 8.24]